MPTYHARMSWSPASHVTTPVSNESNQGRIVKKTVINLLLYYSRRWGPAVPRSGGGGKDLATTDAGHLPIAITLRAVRAAPSPLRLREQRVSKSASISVCCRVRIRQPMPVSICTGTHSLCPLRGYGGLLENSQVLWQRVAICYVEALHQSPASTSHFRQHLVEFVGSKLIRLIFVCQIITAVGAKGIVIGLLRGEISVRTLVQ